MIYNSLYYCVFLLNTFDNIELLKELMLLKDKKYSYLFSYDGSLKNSWSFYITDTDIYEVRDYNPSGFI